MTLLWRIRFAWERLWGLGLYRNRARLEFHIHGQLASIEDVGVKDDFQAGYAHALAYCWDTAGYPSEVSKPAHKLFREYMASGASKRGNGIFDTEKGVMRYETRH